MDFGVFQDNKWTKLHYGYVCAAAFSSNIYSDVAVGIAFEAVKKAKYTDTYPLLYHALLFEWLK